MLKLTYNTNGFAFAATNDGREVPFEDWSVTDDCIYYFPLAELVDNGQAECLGNECIVPYENIYLLNHDDQAVLGVPQQYEKAMRLRGLGTLADTDFAYRLEYLSHVPDGQLYACERSGNVVDINHTQYLLTEQQYALVRLVEDFNARTIEQKSMEENMRCFAPIKELAIEAGCELDSYLANENVYTPDKIKIQIGHDDEGFTLDPAVDIPENANFQHSFDRLRKIKQVYPVQRENGKRVRVLLSDEQKENLDYIKKTGGRRRTREEVQELVDHPTEYFDPDAFDLSDLYSDRVIEIGVYQPKFYPFISPYKSCWIAGATVESPENGTTRVQIENEEELEKLKEAIQKAVEEKKDRVEYKNCYMGLDDAQFLAETAEKQLQSPNEPIKTKTDEEKPARKVLIIEENAEELGFEADKQQIDTKDKYTLYKNQYLADGFALKTHQEEGVAWLQYLYANHASGCLMADDMGLGKTLQILYFIDWHARSHPGHKPYLIVAPVSLLENWENEYNRFFKEPKLKVTRITARRVPRKFDKEIVKRMQQLDIILTNYETLRNAQLNFCAVDFDIVAVDEAQKIKSPGTMVTNAAKALKCKFKIAMTGTPVENTLLDLWCIMDFCVPGLLGNAKEFAAKYQNPLKNEDADVIALGNEIHDKLGIYLMRRLKKDAAKDLPEKIEMKRPVRMPEVQEQMYQQVVNNYLGSLIKNMLVTIMDIRTVSEHPYLHNSTLSEHNSEELIVTSARMMATINFLDSIKQKDEKVIIFAERKETQRMLQRICLERYGIVTKIINGDTPTMVSRQAGDKLSRQKAIDNFQAQEGFNIIIMSPIAAGMGLNVTAANHVIHYSRHWNPAKENQATDRAYRIGQTKDVYVYYPMAVSSEFKSFDETLDDLLNRKTALASSTIFPTERVEVKEAEMAQMLFGRENKLQ